MLTVLPPEGDAYVVPCPFFYHDLNFEAACPRCGLSVVIGSGHEFIHYPVVNGVNTAYFHHRTADGEWHEWQEEFVLRLVAEPVSVRPVGRTGFVDENSGIKSAQGSLDLGANDTPGQPAETAAQGGDGHGSNVPGLDLDGKRTRPEPDVVEPAAVTPVALRR